MKKYLLLIISLLLIGCANCSSSNSDAPYIREQPGVSYCDDMCAVFQKLDCKPYYEDIEINLEDGGTSIMTCTEFCVYELKNSVPLNPECIAKTLTKCEDIENICK